MGRAKSQAGLAALEENQPETTTEIVALISAGQPMWRDQTG